VRGAKGSSALSDHIKELLRVAFACGVTALVGITVFCTILWLVSSH
jgi:hypothetical protein